MCCLYSAAIEVLEGQYETRFPPTSPEPALPERCGYSDGKLVPEPRQHLGSRSAFRRGKGVTSGKEAATARRSVRVAPVDHEAIERHACHRCLAFLDMATEVRSPPTSKFRRAEDPSAAAPARYRKVTCSFPFDECRYPANTRRTAGNMIRNHNLICMRTARG